MANAKPIPEGMHSLTPHLICADAPRAIAFYTEAFGAELLGRLDTPDGKVMHSLMRIGDSCMMLFDAMPEWGALDPKTLNGTPVMLHLYVEDVDATIAQAIKAGATVVMPIADMFWGDRYGQVDDPFGHRWSVATHIKDMSPDEIRAAAAAAPPCGEVSGH